MKMMVLLVAALTVTPVLADDDVVIDYRGSNALDIADPQQWSATAAKIGDGVTVLGEVKGSFTGPESKDVAYLASDGMPGSIDPFPNISQKLVVMKDGSVSGEWTLPEGSAFARPVAARDLDGDGVSEVILEGSFYNMGTLGVGLTSIKLAYPAVALQTLANVYVDSCEAGAGEKSIEASLVRVANGEMVAEPTSMPCP